MRFSKNATRHRKYPFLALAFMMGMMLAPATLWALSDDDSGLDEPRVSVTALRTERGARPQRVDEHAVTQVFFVSAETAVINLSCALSELIITGPGASDSRAGERYTLQPNMDRGCHIEVPGAMATIGGGPLKIAALNNGNLGAGEVRSDYVTFQSVDGQPFEQDVYVTAYWQQRSAMQLSGTYEGAIKLEARIPDEQEVPR